MQRRSFLAMLGLAPVAAAASNAADNSTSVAFNAARIDQAIIRRGTITADKIVAGKITGGTCSCPSVCVTRPAHGM